LTFTKHFYTFIFCCFLGIFSLNSSAQCSSVSENDSLELVKFYNALNGPNWGDTTWLNLPVENWFGITLNDSCEVSQISLNNANVVQGELPADLDLPGLEILNLNTDSIYGEIPDFQNLPNLQTLNLASNALTGPLPDFQNLAELQVLSISFNELTGAFPSFTNMPELLLLNICPNEFEIGYPDLAEGAPLLNISNQDFSCLNCNGIPEADSLELIRFYESTGGTSWSNDVGWAVEDSIKVNLWFGVELSQDECEVIGIDLNSNNLSGIFPADIQLPSLKELSIQQNAILGELPEMAGFPSLTLLEIYDNKFTENFPNLQLPNLIEIDASFNNFFGEIPDFDNLASLQRLYLRLNNLGGPLPDFNLPQLQYLVLDINDIYDEIPDFSNMPNLEFLEMSNNKFSGTIPDFSNLPKLQYLSLDNNGFCGRIPDFSNLPELGGFSVCPNYLLFGDIPSMSATNLVTDDIDFSCVSDTSDCTNLLSIEQLPVFDWQIAPNPTAGMVNFTFNEISDNMLLSIIDLNGKMLFNHKIMQSNFTLNLNHLANGLYVVKLTNGERVEYERISIKQ